MEADKVKKKLNGSILKGSKIKVDEARPKKRRTPDLEGTAEEERDKTQKRKKRKTEKDVLPGVELVDRKVQRGWTKLPSQTKSSKDKKLKSETSAYSSKSECLFRTKIPPNVASSQKLSTKSKSKSKEGKGKTKVGKEAVVHEFSNTTKHATFLRDEQPVKKGKAVSEFVDGKGWVDEQGDLVEQVVPSAEKTRHFSAVSQVAEEMKKKKKRETVYPQPAVSAEDTEKQRSKNKATAQPDDDDTSSSGTSSDEDDSSSQSASSSKAEEEEANSTAEPLIPKTKPTTSSKPTTNGHPTTSTNPNTQPKETHPLETLFKQPPSTNPSPSNPKPTLQVQTSFTFFDPETDEHQPPATITSTNILQTPFTQRDFQQRGLRSAAPTPDTAAPGRGVPAGWARGEDLDEEEEEEEAVEEGDMSEGGVERNVKIKKRKEIGKETGESGVEKKNSSFKDWFWEHRGDTNRAWKKRRREMAKEKRKRENKRLGGRVS